MVAAIGRDIRLARRTLSLSVRAVAAQAGISASEESRLERGQAPWASLVLLSRVCAIVGLDLHARTYPGGRPLREARHARLLDRLRQHLHRSLRWQTEAPLPIQRDQRAWDGMIGGEAWRYGVECELNPLDGQAVLRRLQLKRRDGAVDGVILLLPDTRQTRLFRREFAELLAHDFPVSGRRALELLAAGVDPGGSAIVVL